MVGLLSVFHVMPSEDVATEDVPVLTTKVPFPKAIEFPPEAVMDCSVQFIPSGDVAEFEL